MSITSNGGTTQIRVLMDVDPNPILAVSPRQLDFGEDRQTLEITLENTGTGALEWQVSVPEDWASANPNSGQTRQTASVVQLTVDRENLDAQVYTQIITITGNGKTEAVEIQMRVPESPKLEISPTALDFGSVDNSKTLIVKNLGTGVLRWNITPPAENWISVAPQSGTTDNQTPATVDVQVNRARLNGGTYSLDFTITSNGGEATVSISMTVDKPILSVMPKRLRFDPFTETQTLTISREGFSDLEFEVVPSDRWIIVAGAPFGSLSDDPVTVDIRVSRRDLPQGQTQGAIELRSDLAQNSPIEIPIEVEVLPTFRLIVRDARTQAPIRGAMALGRLSDSSGVIELADRDEREIRGTIEIEGYIDRAFSQRLDETADRVVVLTVDLTPIPRKIHTIRSADFSLPLEIAISGDGSFAYVTNNWGHSVTRMRTNSDTVDGTRSLSGDGENPMGVAVHPITGDIYVANSFVPPTGVGVQNDTISIIPESFGRSMAITVGNRPTAVAVDPNEDRLYVANRDSPSISVIDLDSRRVINTIPLDESPGRLALVRGDLYVTGENSVFVVDPRTGTTVQAIRNVGLNPVDLAVSTNDRFVYVVNNGSADLSVIDTAIRTVIQTLPVGPLPVRIAVTEGFGGGVEALIYVVNQGDSTVTMIEQTSSKWQVSQEVIRVGFNPQGIAVIPDWDKIYMVIQEDEVIEVLGF